MIKQIVFDIGGVLAFDVWEHLLLDPNTGIAAMYDLDFDLVENFAPKLWKEFEHRPATESEPPEFLERLYWERFCEHCQFNQSIDELIRMTEPFIRPVEGMVQILDKIQRKNIPMAICSNNNEFWIRKQFDKVGLHKYFSPETVVSSCRIGASKKSLHHEMFKAVTEIFVSTSEKTVFIEDRFENIKRAMEYGWTGVLFPQASPLGAGYLEKILQRMGLRL